MKDQDFMKKMDFMQNLTVQLNDLYTQKDGMTAYLKLKTSQEDWHGVADAAMDIREIVCKINVLTEILGNIVE